MLGIRAEVQDFSDKNETNYKTDEISKENISVFWIFIVDQNSENYVTYNKIRQANLLQVLVERRMSREK